MSAKTRAHVGFATPVSGDLPAAIHADDDVGHAEHLLEVRRRHNEAIAPVAKLPDQPVDFRPRADIDAAGRLVHQQHARLLAAERAAERKLLLIAAAQLVGRRAQPPPINADRGGKPRGGRAQPPAREHAEPRVLGKPGGDEILSGTEAQKDPFAGPIFGDELHLRGTRPR